MSVAAEPRPNRARAAPARDDGGDSAAEILRAAANAFMVSGFAATSIDDVAADELPSTQMPGSASANCSTRSSLTTTSSRVIWLIAARARDVSSAPRSVPVPSLPRPRQSTLTCRPRTATEARSSAEPSGERSRPSTVRTSEW